MESVLLLQSEAVVAFVDGIPSRVLMFTFAAFHRHLRDLEIAPGLTRLLSTSRKTLGLRAPINIRATPCQWNGFALPRGGDAGRVIEKLP
jgi:hypothetical protein